MGCYIYRASCWKCTECTVEYADSRCTHVFAICMQNIGCYIYRASCWECKGCSVKWGNSRCTHVICNMYAKYRVLYI